MPVICPRQKQAFDSREACGVTVAHICPVCGFWHRGMLYVHCVTRKVPRESEEDAQREADRLNANPDGCGKNYPYKCSKCDNWHVGRPHAAESRYANSHIGATSVHG